jgi:hypothetical protein
MQEGNADAGRYQLETAINTYRNQTGLLGSDTVLAGYHLKLGRWADSNTNPCASLPPLLPSQTYQESPRVHPGCFFKTPGALLEPLESPPGMVLAPDLFVVALLLLPQHWKAILCSQGWSCLSTVCAVYRIYWALGGEVRAEREHCHAELLEAAAEEGPQQAEAFEWLGHWYMEVAGDELHARKCYQRALALNPTLVCIIKLLLAQALLTSG